MVKYDVIFSDWSGCISDDLKAVYTAQSRIVQSYGKKALNLEDWRRAFITISELYSVSGINETNEELARQFKQQFEIVYTEGIKPTVYSEAPKIIEKISREIPIIIVSAHIQHAIEREAEQYSIKQYLTKIYGEIYDKAEFLKREKGNKNAIFIEDMVAGIRAGKKANVPTIAVTRGYHFKDMLIKENPDFIIEDLTGLEKIVL